ncbi:MAG: glycosyltransferase family 2 protein [Ignavibacteria bacterium]|nr:glycosyltransferase family 2 protein [Ignavibacteria bacterium]
MKDTGVIIVVYNQRDFLDDLYNSLKKQTNKNFRIYFIDNASEDNSSEHFSKLNSDKELDVKFISSGKNLGYAGGNNFGAKEAISDGCKYLLILNPDMVLSENFLEKLTELIKSDDIIIATGPLIMFGKNPDIIQEYGGEINFFLGEVRKNFSNSNIKEISVPEFLETQFISGGAMLIRSDAFKKAGMFDERYFAYFDEIDLMRRLRAEIKNSRFIVTSKAMAWHHHQWNPGNKKGYYLEYYLIQRNKYLYFLKYRLFPSLLLSLILDLIKFPVRLIWFKRVCDYKLGYYYLKGIIDGLAGKMGKPELKFG